MVDVMVSIASSDVYRLLSFSGSGFLIYIPLLGAEWPRLPIQTVRGRLSAPFLWALDEKILPHFPTQLASVVHDTGWLVFFIGLTCSEDHREKVA